MIKLDIVVARDHNGAPRNCNITVEHLITLSVIFVTMTAIWNFGFCSKSAKKAQKGI